MLVAATANNSVSSNTDKYRVAPVSDPSYDDVLASSIGELGCSMASSPSDLTLDYKPNGNGTAYAVTIPKPPQEPLVDGHHHHHHHHHLTTAEQATQKLREFLARLEEERLKIDAFKRELPLCMQLLNHCE